MARRRTLGALALPALVAVLVLPSTLSSAAPSTEFLFLNVRGTAERQPGTAPDRFAYVLDVYDATNQKIGTVTHDAAFTSATTADLVSTFRLPDGDLVNHATEAFAPDSSRQNFFLTGIHPERGSLLADKSTGAYAGRTGQLRMSGWHDGSKFPQTLAVNDFYAIELTPR